MQKLVLALAILASFSGLVSAKKSPKNSSSTASNQLGVYKIDLADLDEMEQQSLNYLNRYRNMVGMKEVQISQELMVMAQNEADRLANLSSLETFSFNVDNRSILANLYRITAMNKKGERIGVKKCYNLNDKLFVLSDDDLYHVAEECRTSTGRKMSKHWLTEFGYGKAFDLATNSTLFHVRLFYYTHDVHFDQKSLNAIGEKLSQMKPFHKRAQKTGLKYLRF